MTRPKESSEGQRLVRATDNLPIGELLRRPWVMELLLASATFLLYCGTLAFRFVYDDRMQILQNAAITRWSYVPQYFTGNVWALIDRTILANYYRPLFLLWLRINHSLFGYEPAGWHALSVGLHVVATLQTYWLVRRLLRSDWAAAGAAALFAVHPVHIESVTWVSGATDPLLAIFLLGSTLAFLRYIEARESNRVGTSDYAAALVFAALALLSKEVAVMLPLLMVPAALCTRTEKTTSRQIGRAAIPFFVLIAAYLVVRQVALAGFSHPLTGFSTSWMLLTWPSVIAFYLRQLFAPFWISPYANVHWVTAPSARDFWMPLAICVAILAAAILLWKRSRDRSLLTVAYAWIVFPVLPVLYLKVFSAAELVHDRYLYVSCVGLSVLVAVAFRAILRWKPEASRALRSAAAAALLLLAAMTFNGELYWASDLLLFQHALELAPENDSAAVNLGVMYAEHDRPDLAEPLLKAVCDRNPNSAPAAHNYAHLLFLTQRNAEAEKYFQRALQADPQQDTWWIEYAGVEMKLGKLQDADRAAIRALSLDGRRPEFHVIRGAILSEAGDLSRAEQEFRAALALDPANVGAKRGLEGLQQLPK